ncbi:MULTISPECIES: hypothetical protein [Staphylococcus]|uniref:hypothetical protein n=1 Tax=Staphylococcus TaxID=1279 RepID=UPI00255213C7|nr:hypothetical protein [Staphylococcus equorum]MDK9870510.1 hypothetical protein [Staphylococcus equorum]MDK9878260.1 hypothetical protein [Staphylococcus equorum]MDN6842782.1 hypothetical protein [Staphylococcus equorum]MDN6848996.1 hypothetical protein [Staphylococcus equorum]
MSRPDLSLVRSMNETDVGKTIPEATTLNKYDIMEIKKVTIEALMEYEERSLDLGGRKQMSEYVKREEYENFKNHLDTKFDRIIDKLDENRREIKDDITTSRQEIKDDINEFKNRTLTVFGLAVTVIGIAVPVVLHFI